MEPKGPLQDTGGYKSTGAYLLFSSAAELNQDYITEHQPDITEFRMGNAAVIINHPTSLDHGQPMLEDGEVAAEEPGMIRLQRSSGTASGCGGTITFKKNVKSCESSDTMETERGVTVSGGVEASVGSIGVSAGIEVSQVATRQDSTKIKHIVSDKNEMSELWCHVDYVGKKGKYKWLSNDLNLKAKHRWSENSEMFLKIGFREDSDSDDDSEYKEELAE